MGQQMIQVAGYSNSGKTTLVEKLITAMSKENLRVGSIKHHGHGGDLATLDSGKDSWKHRQAGAVVSAAVSKGKLQLNVVRNEHWEVTELVALYSNFLVDVIIIEGFKTSSFPKVVIIKEAADLTLLTKLKNIICVISWIPLPLEMKTAAVAYFQIDEEIRYIDFIIQELKGQDND
ncbi:molybdopterin-guanine dinucleotide biosynthesis protein B [Bacillaceae bacterium IKA-2]|nr:molybdopterin-guanine dinucleotide biosynthesis protein B [Bacillaceae bacterium IKA-2]